MAKLTIYGDRTTRWHGSEGKAFAMRIGRKDRHKIVRFVLSQSSGLPTTARLDHMDRDGPRKVVACITNNVLRVGFTYLKYFVLMNFENVTPSVQQMVVLRLRGS